MEPDGDGLKHIPKRYFAEQHPKTITVFSFSFRVLDKRQKAKFSDI
jgi:hypothetical protein